MTDLKATIRIVGTDNYEDPEMVAEKLCDTLADLFEDPPEDIIVHILIESTDDGRPIAERRIVGADQ